MLCNHVGLRQFLKPLFARLTSGTATSLPRARGLRIQSSPDEPSTSPRPRGRPRKNIDALGLNSKESAKKRSKPRVTKDSAETATARSTSRSRKIKDVGPEATKAVKVKRTSKPSGADAVQGPMKRRTEKQAAPRISLLAPTTNHHDLASFLEHSRKVESKPGTTVYRGTHYEYTVIEFLKTYNFTLRRTGRSNDLGIDLLGHWHLPADPQELRVLVQCKASKPKPAMIRELEGAYVGAPAGWRGVDVMALLITRDPATLGVRNALQRSRLPMGFAQITEEGVLRQFMWNHVAQEARLTGMSVTSEYRRALKSASSGSGAGSVESAVSLQWMGKQWDSSLIDSRPAV